MKRIFTTALSLALATLTYSNALSDPDDLYSPERNRPARPLSPEQQMRYLEMFQGFLGGIAPDVERSGNPMLQAIHAQMNGLIGHSVASVLDQQDRNRQYQTVLSGLQSGRDLQWNNPSKGTSGGIETVSEFRTADGRSCKTYWSNVTVMGEQTREKVTSCLGKDGAYHPIA